MSSAIDQTLGAMLIGVVIAGILYGVSCVQMFMYFTTYQDDPWYIKLLVVSVWVFDTIHQILITHSLYFYTVQGFINNATLGLLVWSILVEVLFSALIALFVQSFLAMRIWRLSNKSIWLTAAVMALVLTEFGMTMAYLGQALQFATFIELASIRNLTMSINVVTAVVDVVIAVLLCGLLHKARTGFQRSNTIINRLIIFAVNTGVLTSLCAIASLLSNLLAPNTFLYICFFFSLGRLYSNSLLCTLNARRSVRAAADTELSSSLNASGQGRVLSNSNAHTKSKSGMEAIQTKSAVSTRTPINIKIDTTEEYMRDPDMKRGSRDIESGVAVPYGRGKSVDASDDSI